MHLNVKWPMFTNKKFMRAFTFFLLLIFSPQIFSWSEPISSNGAIKAIHINELRNITNLKRQCYGLNNATWTDTPVIERTTRIKSVHLTEIRLAINSLYSSCTAGLCTGGSGIFVTANKIWSEILRSGVKIKSQHIAELRDTLDAITCTPYTYNWLTGSYGSCAGGSGSWSYGPFGGCNGGSGYWGYGGWGGCSVACGDGIQYRSYACYPYANSGIQYRAATCNFHVNSGIATRLVQCQRSDTVIMADSFCNAIPKPSPTQACTPNNSAVCGATYMTSQACTPASVGCYPGPANAQGCNNGPCCSPTNESMNMCSGHTFTAQAYGTWTSPEAMFVLAINANAACNTFNPGRCRSGSATVTFITPCTVCAVQGVTCMCN